MRKPSYMIAGRSSDAESAVDGAELEAEFIYCPYVAEGVEQGLLDSDDKRLINFSFKNSLLICSPIRGP